MNYIRIELNSKNIKNLYDDKFSEEILGTDFITLKTFKNLAKKPFEFNLIFKKKKNFFQSANLYRIGDNGIFIKLDAQLEENQVKFKSYQSGTYFLLYESNITAIIGISIGLFILLLIICFIVVFLLRNPNFLNKLRHRARNIRRSATNRI